MKHRHRPRAIMGLTSPPLRPEFAEGDVVMICRHLYEQACKGLGIKWSAVLWQQFDPPQKFNREDETSFTAKYAVWCSQCDPKTTDYVEEVYERGQLHVADFMRAHGAPRLRVRSCM